MRTTCKKLAVRRPPARKLYMNQMIGADKARARGAATVPHTLLSLSGFNLLRGQHGEFAPGDAFPRSIHLETRLKF
jgi:hypothetical protein